MVLENGQYVYKPVQNFYGYYYPVNQGQQNFPAQEIQLSGSEHSESEQDDIVLEKKLQKKRLRIRIRPKQKSLEIPEKKIEKKKKLRKKKLPEQIEEKKEIHNEKNLLHHSENASNEIDLSNCICYHTPPNSEVSELEQDQYKFTLCQPYEEAGDLETFLKRDCQCHNEPHIGDKSSVYSSVKHDNQTAGAKDQQQKSGSGEKRDDLLNCFDPSY
jgi:hypothetical protein